MKYELCKKVMIDDKKRKGFDALIHQTFKLSFEKWYQNGEWSEWNQPYTLYDGEKAIANITVNHMKFLYEEKVREYIQLGGVVTDPAYRGQGLSRYIMEEVQKDWKNQCDGMFLLANRSVTEFYPKFGFVEENQYKYIWKNDNQSAIGKNDNCVTKDSFTKNDNSVMKLDLSQKEDQEIFRHCYDKQNPFSILQSIDNISLVQFYCYYGMNENMYYLPDEDAVVIAEYEDNKILCYDIYYDGTKNMMQIMSNLLQKDTTEIEFLFTPKQQQGLEEQKYYDEDTHLFILKDKENIFTNKKLYMPEISHT